MSEQQSCVPEELEDAPILHVHPSLRCNLACAHCYSGSSPQETGALKIARLVEAIEDASEIGFRILSVSGGEPFMFAGLGDILATAKRCGMRTQVVTNGWFLKTRRYFDAEDLIDVIAVSLDGLEERHNRMRGSSRAFDKVQSGLAELRRRSRAFAIIHTATADNWNELFDVARFCVDAGATALQIHSLEVSGRAEARLRPSDEIAARILVVSAALKIWYGQRLNIHVDLQHRNSMSVCDGSDPLRSTRILVVEGDGTLVPVSYGFDRRFALGNINGDRLAEAWSRFAARGHSDFLALRNSVASALASPAGPIAFNWFEELSRASRQFSELPTFHKSSEGNSR